jgi:uncharacterized membrane protein YdcZ (DUF606 family)
MGSALLVAVVVGVAIALQVAVLGGVARRLHPLAMSLALQCVGVVAGVLWATAAHAWRDVIATARFGWWVPLGILGWVLVAALGYASGRIGVVATLGVSVAVQLLVGLAIDVTAGRVALGPRPLVGVLLLAAGVLLSLPAAEG